MQRLAFDGSERWRRKVGGGGVLCIALHPDFDRQTPALRASQESQTHHIAVAAIGFKFTGLDIQGVLPGRRP